MPYRSTAWTSCFWLCWLALSCADGAGDAPASPIASVDNPGAAGSSTAATSTTAAGAQASGSVEVGTDATGVGVGGSPGGGRGGAPTGVTSSAGSAGSSTLDPMTGGAGGAAGGAADSMGSGGSGVAGMPSTGTDAGGSGVGGSGVAGMPSISTDVGGGVGGTATGGAGVGGDGSDSGGANEPAHPDDAVEYDGHWYRLTETSIDPAEAEAACEALGGYLACVESEAEDDFLFTVAGTTRPWIGLNNEDDVNTWVWINGTPVTYTHWQPGQPDNPNAERWVKIAEDGTWDDGNIPSSYICEWET